MLLLNPNQTKAESQARNRAGQYRFEARLTRAESGLRRPLASARNRFIRAAAEAWERHQDPLLLREASEHRDEVAAILVARTRLLVPIWAEDTYQRIRSAKADQQGRWQRFVTQWIEAHALERAGEIAGTAKRDVTAAITKGIAAGEGAAAIARRIRKVTILTPWRADAVARTETHAAVMFANASGAREAERDFGIRLVKVWMPTIDSRTRDAHAAMIRHAAIPLDHKFNVGGELLDRPGDPRGSAANIINCRCGLIHREQEYEYV